MTTDGKSQKTKATVRSIDDEIAAAEEKVRRLKEQKREAENKAREKNIKAVLELLRNEKLDLVDAAIWEKELPKIRALLIPGAASATKVTGGKTETAGQPSAPSSNPAAELGKAA